MMSDSPGSWAVGPRNARLLLFKENENMLSLDGYITMEDGISLFYCETGQGESAVLVPNGLYFLEELKELSHTSRLIVFDVRNRGRSDAVPLSQLKGIQQDIEDIDAVRRHFGLERVTLIGHSYAGLMVALYATRYPQHVNRLVQISPMQPDSSKQYPPDLTNTDGVAAEVSAKLGELQKLERSQDPEENCKRFWSALRPIFVADPGNAQKIQWGRCELPNERGFMKYWAEVLVPSIRAISFSAEQCRVVDSPVLIIHGRKDRNSPYGGARDWAMTMPNARLLTLENAAHAPWIEAKEAVMDAIHEFLQGSWPASAEILTAGTKASKVNANEDH